MTVQELIDELMKIEDKSMAVMLADWVEAYTSSEPLNSIEILAEYEGAKVKPYLCLDSKAELL